MVFVRKKILIRFLIMRKIISLSGIRSVSLERTITLKDYSFVPMRMKRSWWGGYNPIQPHFIRKCSFLGNTVVTFDELEDYSSVVGLDLSRIIPQLVIKPSINFRYDNGDKDYFLFDTDEKAFDYFENVLQPAIRDGESTIEWSSENGKHICKFQRNGVPIKR